jgi:CelD/BcsL family acetyltransferase involved in cellulose biosynthesis
MEAISAKTYHRGLGVGFTDSAETRGLFATALDHGWQRAYVLYVRGTPCAFWEGLTYRQSFFPTSTAYDPAFEEHRPGAFLLMHIIEQSCGERVSQIDFGFGDANYKRWYSNQNWQEASLCICAPSMKGFALFTMKTPMALVEHMVRKGLEKARLLQRVKTLWRRHVCGRQQIAPAG